MSASSKLLSFSVSLAVGGFFAVGMSGPASAQLKPPTADTPTIKKKPRRLALPALTVQQKADGKAFLKKEAKLKASATELYLALQKVEKAHTALRKKPTDKRLVRAFVTHSSAARKLALTLQRQLSTTGDEQGPNTGGTGGDSGGSGGGEQGPQGGGAKVVYDLAVSISGDLSSSLRLTGTRRLKTLTSRVMGSLDRQLAITGSRGDDLHAIIEPIMYR